MWSGAGKHIRCLSTSFGRGCGINVTYSKGSNQEGAQKDVDEPDTCGSVIV
jgi:hypothetical protein